MSPEVLGHQRYSYANDAYSFGIVLWETASRARLSNRIDISDLPQTLNLLRAWDGGRVRGRGGGLGGGVFSCVMLVALLCWNLC